MSRSSEATRARRRGGRLYPPTVAPPGSDRAFVDGCTCPPDDNHGGQFLPRQGWTVDLDCTLHTGDVQWSAPRGIASARLSAELAWRRTPLTERAS